MNAVDAMKPLEAGRLDIRFREAGKYVEIAIEDSGIGIPADRMPYLFDPFYTSKDGGTGLGLAITYSIIEKNRGKIAVESTVGKGTVFKVLLPKAPAIG